MRFDKGYCLNMKDSNYLINNKFLSIWNQNKCNKILGLNKENLEYRKKVINLARDSVVLLKNYNNILPLNKEEIRTIAIIGKGANIGSNKRDRNNKVKSLYEVSPLLGIKINMGPNTEVKWSRGYSEDSLINKELLNEAIDIAKNSDITIFIDEFTNKKKHSNAINKTLHISKQEKEDLTYNKEILINELTKVNKNTIIVIHEKSQINIKSLFNKVGAVLQTWYSGAEFGTALAEILVGEVNPSYKLPVYWPKSSAEFPFGYGLSYTKFKYSNLKITTNANENNSNINIKFSITNIGETSGTEICQIYIGGKELSKKVLAKKLISFRRVYLEPNDTKEIELNLSKKSFFLDNYFKEDFFILVGSSSIDLKLKEQISVK